MADDKRRDNYEIELGERTDKGQFDASPRPQAPRYSPAPSSSLANHPIFPVVSYCLSSILMTVTNKYVVSGSNWNLNFFLLAVQSVVCIVAIQTAKTAGAISFRDFKVDEARKWFPISLLLIGMIYTGAKAIRFLSIPVYTIFKNITIIFIAYGEVLWFGGSVSRMSLFSFGLMVLSSVVAAWGDITHALESHGHSSSEATTAISTLNAGYVWMMINCFCTASYMLFLRKRIKLTNFKDYDTMFYNNLLTIPVLIVASLLVEDWSSANVAQNFPKDTRNRMITAMVFSGLCSIFISYTSAWCVRVTSSTTYSMVGALNKLPIALSGFVFFDTPVTFPGISALGLGFLSGIVYAVAKVQQSSKPKTGVLPTSNPPMSASSQSMRDGLKP